MPYRAVLFDLDGTLLNTLEDLAEAVNRGLQDLKLPVLSLADFKYVVGEGREEMVRKSLPADRRDPATIAWLLDFVNRYYNDHCCDHTRPYPGIPALLNALRARGLRLAVFSNKPQEFTSLTVRRLLSDWPFELVLGACQTVPKKPDPAAAILIAAEMQIAVSNFLYLGDSGLDMLTAARAGMFGVGVLWGFRDRVELLDNGAKALIEKPLDLLDLL